MRSMGALSLRRTAESSTAHGVTRGVPAAVLRMVPRTAGVLALLVVGSSLGGLDHDPLAPPAERPTDQARAVRPPSAGAAAKPGRSLSELWKPAYSERYPGCVPAVLWPADEKPVAVLTMAPDGRVTRVAIDAQRRLASPVPAAARTIGACR